METVNTKKEFNKHLAQLLINVYSIPKLDKEN